MVPTAANFNKRKLRCAADKVRMFASQGLLEYPDSLVCPSF